MIITNCIPVNVLLDTGATSDNYVSPDIAKAICDSGVETTPCTTCVCSGLGDSSICYKCMGSIYVPISFYNQLTKVYDTLNLNFKILEIKYNVVIGLPTIWNEGLILKCIDRFVNPMVWKSLRPLLVNVEASTREDSYAPFEEAKRTGSPAVPEALSRVSALYSQMYRKKELIDIEPDDDFVDPDIEPQEPWLNEKVVDQSIHHDVYNDPSLPLLYGSD